MVLIVCVHEVATGMILYVLSLGQILTAMDDVQKVQTLESLKWATETGSLLQGHSLK